MDSEEHQQIADRLDRGGDELQEQGEKLDQEIKDTKEDWESKLSSSDAPGATGPEAATPGGLGEDEEDQDEDHDEDR